MTLIEHYLEYVNRPYKEDFARIYMKARELADSAEELCVKPGIDDGVTSAMWGEIFDYASAMLSWNEMDAEEYKRHMRAMRAIMSLMLK